MSSSRGNPEDEELIAAAVASALLNLFGATLGVVKSYDDTKKTAEVQPAIRRPLETDEGEVVQETPTICQNVMVCHWGSSGLTSNHVLAAGDVVILVYLDYSPALFRKRGQVSDTPDTHKSGPSYPVAIPFFRPSGGPGTDSGNSIGKPGGLRITFEAGHVRVGTGADFVALAGPTNDRLDALELAVTQPHGTTSPGSPTVPAPFTPGAGSVSASNLKADS